MKPENSNFTVTQPPITATAASRSVEEQLHRIEELGQMLLEYNDVTERLEASHSRLAERVEQLQRELSEKNRELARRQRLSALGEMAAGLAHEIRNPLGAIQLFASMLKDDLKEQPTQLHLAQRIGQGVVRLESLVSQVLQFTRELRVNRGRCDLARVVDDAIEMARAKAGELVVIKADLPATLFASVDGLLIGQAVLNLVLNGIEAIKGPGAVAVTLSQNQTHIELSIRDTGPGIEADVLEKIFHPFFTTKDHGTGLGLAIVHRVVEAHDGTITARTHESGGAAFVIRLPNSITETHLTTTTATA